MTRIASVAAATLAAFLAGAPATTIAQDSGPAAVVADTTTSTATVAKVDRANRKVTLRGGDGQEETLTLGPEVRNFDQIQVGDTVTAEYVKAIAVFMRAPGEAPSGAALTAIQVAPKGAKPGATMMQQEEVTATIDDIDYAKRTVKLRNAAGQVRQINVDERIQNLDRFKKGDELIIRHTEALAIAVTK
jgi:Cu/Ag efflux protein CusF